MQTVRIAAIPVCRPLGTSRFGLGGIELAMAVSEVVHLVRLLDAITFRIVKTVPSPLTLCPQRHTIPIVLRECLQACHIRGEGKAAIAHAQRSQRVYRGHNRVVAADQRLAVNRLFASCCR